jgi:Fic family protein
MPDFAFLQGLDKDIQSSLLNQLRYLWTHTSTSLEGNTLSLGETKFVIEEGLTISGKSLKDHQEVAYNNIHEPLFFSHLIFLSLLFMD